MDENEWDENIRKRIEDYRKEVEDEELDENKSDENELDEFILDKNLMDGEEEFREGFLGVS